MEDITADREREDGHPVSVGTLKGFISGKGTRKVGAGVLTFY